MVKRYQRKLQKASILPNLSKIFEKCMVKKLSQFFENILSKYTCGFRKGFSIQLLADSCLLAMLEKSSRPVDNSKIFGALQTYILKAFDCLGHELLITKLNAYGFSLIALKLEHNYLSNRKQRTKTYSSYSILLEIVLRFHKDRLKVLHYSIFFLLTCSS